jgi:hypothetical protein|tara:strand:- start:2637 stop:2984 length:348 start_codon:yes stop_codon:yes gene_type:complete
VTREIRYPTASNSGNLADRRHWQRSKPLQCCSIVVEFCWPLSDVAGQLSNQFDVRVRDEEIRVGTLKDSHVDCRIRLELGAWDTEEFLFELLDALSRMDRYSLNAIDDAIPATVG